MNKFARLMALALVCAMAMGLVTVAHADTCYEMLKYTFSIEDNGDFAWLGQGTLVPGEEPAEESSNAVFFYVSFESGYASVIGRNAEGEPESCLWMEANPADLLLASVQVAASYDQLTEALDQCTELVLVLESGEESEMIYIASSEDAQAYLTLLQSAMENMAAEVEGTTGSGTAVQDEAADEPATVE